MLSTAKPMPTERAHTRPVVMANPTMMSRIPTRRWIRPQLVRSNEKRY